MKKMQLLMFLFVLVQANLILQYPGFSNKLKAIVESQWEKYYNCLEQEFKSLEPSFFRKLETKLILPGQTSQLPCPSCQRPFEDKTLKEWRYQRIGSSSTETYFENLPSEFMLSASQELIIRNARPDYTGVFRCYLGNDSLITYFIEVPKMAAIAKVDDQHSEESPIQTMRNAYKLYVDWGEESECSKCGKVGKRYRYGVCMITNAEQGQNSTMGEDMESAKYLPELHYLLELFPKGIPCTSKLLKEEVLAEIKATGGTHLVATQFCKIECDEKNQNDQFELKDSIREGNMELVFKYLHENIPTVEREVVETEVDVFLILQCPGTTSKNIPITWRTIKEEVIPELLHQQTLGRVWIDAFNRIVIEETKTQDSNIYSCWQRSRLIGTIHLFIEEQGGDTKTRTALTMTTALLLACLAIHIVILAVKYRRKN